jgi:hypothetical protein
MAHAGAALHFATCGGALDVLAAGVEVEVTGYVVDTAGGARADVFAAGIVVGVAVVAGEVVPAAGF